MRRERRGLQCSVQTKGANVDRLKQFEQDAKLNTWEGIWSADVKPSDVTISCSWHMRTQSLKSCSMSHEATVYLDLLQSFTLKAHDGACALLTGHWTNNLKTSCFVKIKACGEKSGLGPKTSADYGYIWSIAACNNNVTVIPFKWPEPVFHLEIDSLIRLCWMDEWSCHDSNLSTFESGDGTQDQVSGLDLREDYRSACRHRELQMWRQRLFSSRLV